MIRYCTVDDLLQRFDETELIQLTDDTNLGFIDEDKIEKAIDDASAEMDSYLSAYDLPFNDVPRVLQRLCCENARFYLYRDAATEQVEKQHNNNMIFLEKVSKGELSLGLTASGDDADKEDTVQMTSGGRVFARKDNSFI